MSQIYKFFNSADNDLRTYQAGDFADYFGSVLSTGLIHTDEVPGMKTFVEGGTLRTYVTPGKAIMQGHLYENTTNEYLEHSLPESSADRIDRIILRLDLRNSERNILLHIKEGDPSENPTAPDLQRDNFIYEVSLAQIRVRANTSSLKASDLIDERLDEDLCGLVNSMLTIPTTQFLSEWNTFMDTIRDQSPASQGDLDNLETNFSSHKAESASKHITESGSNENGRYVKFDDGTAIATKRSGMLTIDPTAEYVSVSPITFLPGTATAFFSATPNTRAIRAKLHNLAINEISTNGMTTEFRVINNADVPMVVALHLVAIGRWK